MRALTPALAALGVVVAAFTRFLAWAEARPGVPLADPVLARLPAADVSAWVFLILYASLAWTLWRARRAPATVAAGLYAYALVCLMRGASIFLVPLAAPPGLLSLRDPFVRLFEGRVIDRDLFFSGHVATMTLLVLLARERREKLVLGAAAVFVAVLVLVQHAHYAVDALAAPPFAWLAWRAGRRLAGA
ncbi:MAG: hypothetical protein HY079_10645 [Elusimicrobia bacterium]|nr:hypothetical protein [Elusimicrobiota bacterium]